MWPVPSMSQMIFNYKDYKDGNQCLVLYCTCILQMVINHINYMQIVISVQYATEGTYHICYNYRCEHCLACHRWWSHEYGDQCLVCYRWWPWTLLGFSPGVWSSIGPWILNRWTGEVGIVSKSNHRQPNQTWTTISYQRKWR